MQHGQDGPAGPGGQLRAALIGAGNVSRVHLAALRDSALVRVVGIFDAERERAEARAAEYGLPRVYDSWRALLEDPTVDVVGVLLPHDLHREYTVAALEAGKHVVCEKPLAATLQECDAMLDAAGRAGRRLLAVQNRLYHAAYERLGELVRRDAIGPVFLAQTNGFEGPQTVSVRPWLGTARPGGGVLLAQAVHPAYALRWLLGEVAQVACTFGRRKVVEMVAEDTAVVTLLFRSGAVAEMTATFGLRYGPFDHAIMLYGEAGYLELRMTGDRSRPQALRAIAPGMFGDQALHEIDLPPGERGATSFRLMWEDYAGSILTGAPARVTDEDGRKAVEIILAAHRANATGRTVALPL